MSERGAHSPGMMVDGSLAQGDRPTAGTPGEPKPEGVLFADLGLARPLLAALKREGYECPTPIQASAIPPAMRGCDVMGCAQTGTGKTAAFVLPVLHRLVSAAMDTSKRGRSLPRVLVLSPTRELATQIAESVATYGRETAVTFTTVFGGVGQAKQVRALRAGVDVLVATPGRLIDLMDQGHVDLSRVDTFVLDEADRMLDMGFIAPIRRIAGSMPTGRQTLMFSATMPREIESLANSLLKDPVRVAVAAVASAAPKIEQGVYHVSRTSKPALLRRLLAAEGVERAVVFTRTKHGADRLCETLQDAGVTAGAIHGNKAQNQRERALQAFRSGRSRVLVATDVAARGLDVDGITHVFNYDLPREAEAYVHRIGRTGRAGATGIAVAFCDSEERGLLKQIERLMGQRVPVLAMPEGMTGGLGEPGTAGAIVEPRRANGGGGGRSGPRPAPMHRGGHAGQSSHPAGAGHGSGPMSGRHAGKPTAKPTPRVIADATSATQPENEPSHTQSQTASHTQSQTPGLERRGDRWVLTKPSGAGRPSGGPRRDGRPGNPMRTRPGTGVVPNGGGSHGGAGHARPEGRRPAMPRPMSGHTSGHTSGAKAAPVATVSPTIATPMKKPMGKPTASPKPASSPKPTARDADADHGELFW